MASYAMTLSAVLSTISISALTAGVAYKLAPLSAAAGLRKGPTLEVSATTRVLPTGLTLIVHEDHSAPLVVVRITYPLNHAQAENAGYRLAAVQHLEVRLSERTSNTVPRAVTRRSPAKAMNGLCALCATSKSACPCISWMSRRPSVKLTETREFAFSVIVEPSASEIVFLWPTSELYSAGLASLACGAGEADVDAYATAGAAGELMRASLLAMRPTPIITTAAAATR